MFVSKRNVSPTDLNTTEWLRMGLGFSLSQVILKHILNQVSHVQRCQHKQC